MKELKKSPLSLSNLNQNFDASIIEKNQNKGLLKQDILEADYEEIKESSKSLITSSLKRMLNGISKILILIVIIVQLIVILKMII